MNIKIGSHTHPANEVDRITLTQRIVRNRRNRPQYVTKTLTLSGVLIPASATQASIKTSIEELEAAYLNERKTVGLYHDDGTASPHVLDTNQSISGVRIVSKDYPDAGPAEYATQRSFTFVCEADFLVSGADPFVSWEESLSFDGTCGPKIAWKYTLNGPPQQQTVHQATTQIVTQQGSAVGYFAYPLYPAPLFPQLELQDRRRTVGDGPERSGDSLINWGIRWTYVFESASPLFGRPTVK